jgi:EF hand
MTKAIPIFGTLIFAVSPISIGTLAAQPSPEALGKVAEMMIEADLNGDGRTSRAELNQHRAQMFARLDRNEDGTIAADDSPRLRIAKRRFDPAFEQVRSIFDSNADGRVTLVEWNRSEPDVFALLDSNEDGVVTRAELPTPR